MEGSFYLNVVKNSRCITYNTSKAAFGFTETDHKKTSLIPSLILRNRPGSIFSSRARRSSAASLSFTPNSSRRSKLQVQRRALPLTHGTDLSLSFTSPVQASTCLHYSTVERARSTITPSLAVGTPPKNMAALAEILVYKYPHFSTDDDSELSAIREGYPALSFRRAH